MSLNWGWLDNVLSTAWGKLLFMGGAIASLFWVFSEKTKKREIAMRRASEILDEIETIHKSCLKDDVKVDQIHDCIHELAELED